MSEPQAGILAALPPLARYLSLSLRPDADARAGLRALRQRVDGDSLVVGIGPALVGALGREIAGLRPFPALAAPGLEIPSTPRSIWAWLRGTDRGELFHASRRLESELAGVFQPEEAVDAFQFGGGRDLTGFEDGTENPKGDAARAAAIVPAGGGPPAGSSFVAVQRWVHRFDRFEAMSAAEQDAAIGRHREGNEEIGDAPRSAHVKRTAQESFAPPAFVLRRSMPWAEGRSAGLMFVAFGASLDPFEAQLRRMAGLEDGVPDALFRFTRPVSGATFWCPPMRDGRLDLGALGVE
jgi:putative iron-dependent peroxidase